MPKIAFIGAGSTVFTRNLLRDMFLFRELHGAEVALMDIDPSRLRDSEVIAQRTCAAAGANAQVTATTDRRRALDGADYVINMIQVGGYRPSTVIDFDLPRRFGLRQTIGDTLGVAGVMRFLRTAPVLLGICRDMEELCGTALLLNYTNPMAMLMWAVSAASPVAAVGLCHSVQGTAEQLASALDIPSGELIYRAAGINHMAFFLRLEHAGADVYPRLRALAADPAQVPVNDLVRFEMLRRLGYFVTESSEHFSEYVPWFIKDRHPELISRYNIPLDEYPRRCESQIADWESMRTALVDSDSAAMERYEREGHTRWLAHLDATNPRAAARQRAKDAALGDRPRHSSEYGSLIIHSMETGQPRVIYGNVPNAGLIDGLPTGCCVEVPCLVDHNGIQPTRVGALPPQLAALMRTNVNVQELAVRACIDGRRDHVYHAAMLDPHTAAELTIDEIYALVDALLAEHGEMIPALAV